MLTFGTTIGRFCFKWLSYGIHPGSEVFQKTVSSIISDIQGSADSQDDIIIWGKILEEVVWNLIRTNVSFANLFIVFLGDITSSEGIRIDPSKTDAITKMEGPWRDSFKEPKKHSVYHPPFWNEVDYPSRTFRTWKSEKTCPSSPVWPLSNSEIEDMKKNCPTCLTFRNRQPSEPTIKHPVPEELWNKLAADFFWLYGHYYLLVVDYNSKFVSVENLKNSHNPLSLLTRVKNIFSVWYS